MATPETAVALYNYEVFIGGESDFTAFRSKLPIGSPAPDFTVVALDSGGKYSYVTTGKTETWSSSSVH